MDNPYLPTVFPAGCLDERFQTLVTSHQQVCHAATQWEGAFFKDTLGNAQGRMRLEHCAVSIMRWHAPIVTRSLDGAQGWLVLAPQSRVWLPGEQFHVEWQGRVRSQSLYLTPTQVERILEQPFGRSGLQAWAGFDFTDPVVSNLVASLVVDCSQGHAHGALRGETVIAELVSHLGRGMAGRDAAGVLLGSRLHAVLDYMRAHLQEAVSLQALSAQAHCTPRHFARLFRHSMGISAHQYLLHLRIERACELLRRDQQSLSEVAMDVGFADQSQLTKAFGKLCGTSPSQYRAMARRTFGWRQ